ncbi:MAG: master DNA invertase Mpi family serine-type recombinase [Rickettsiales bacterium]|jgi:DNA invertase Pin-like site-specific DNA recombinase|nr:master DNA invertase Mpi family serine-type recombinase [Rickettsiales bacterium]
MVYGYIRVSTDHQNTENQRFEIRKFCQKENLVIDKWIEETISATKDLKKRKLGKLIGNIKEDDLIVASELSRLGRNLLQIMSILHHCMSIGAKIWTIKDNYRLGSDISSKVLAFAFGLSAEIERNLISQRTKEALARVKSEGKAVGRPCGSRNDYKLSGREKYIEQKLDSGVSQYALAKRLRVHRDTLSKFIKAHRINEMDAYYEPSDANDY